jgi:putative copper export protein
MTPAHLPWALATLSTLARALWFVAWSALAGGAAWAWLFDGPHRAASEGALAAHTWRRAVQLGWLCLCWATTLSLLAVLLAAVTTSDSSPVGGEAGLGWVVLALGLALLRPVVRRTAGPHAPVAPQDRTALTWLAGALALGEVLTQPTHSSAPAVVRTALDAAHLASAGVWLGSLALLVVLVRTSEWRAAHDRGAAPGGLVRRVVEAGCRAAAVTVVSGIGAAAATSPGLGRWATEYSGLLVAKAAVLGVAAAIAWRQWASVHARRPAAVLGRSLLVQTGALVSAAAIAAVLVGVDPLTSATAAAGAGVAWTSSLQSPPCVTARSNCSSTAIASVVSGTPGNALDAVVPGLCTADPTKPKAFAYFSCLQAVGQALAQQPGGGLGSLDHCLQFPGTWAEQSCAAGIFSALTARELASAPAADPNHSDQVWPCRSVPDDLAPSCYLLAATRILWLNGGDLRAAFRACDGLAPEWQGYCYQGAGREITTRAGYTPSAILLGCGSAGVLGPGPCLEGAARTLVFTDHDAAAAALCAAGGPVNGPACDSERQAALATM